MGPLHDNTMHSASLKQRPFLSVTLFLRPHQLFLRPHQPPPDGSSRTSTQPDCRSFRSIKGEHCELRLELSLCLPHLHTSKRGVDARRGLMSAPTRCPEEDQHACHLRLPFVGPCRVSTPLRRGGNGEEVRTCGVCAMDQILLRRSRDEHTPARSSAERIPSHLSVACAEACDIVPPFRCFSLMIL